ncbi:hypothetical protein WN55_10272, partial [Dufourea novaeangliae]
SKYDVIDVPKTQDECIGNLCDDMQNTKMMTLENDNVHIRHTSSEMLCIDKNELICLQCELKNLVSTTEENLIKIKSTLSHVTKLLSIPDQTGAKSEVCEGKQGYSESEKVSNTMSDRERQIEICCKLIEPPKENLKSDAVHVSQNVAAGIQSTNTSKSKKEDTTDKENHNADESFVQLENELNIAHANPAVQHCSQKLTPIITKYQQKRSLREYMVLKSSMTFLETPDGKKFKSLYQKNDTDASVLSRTYLSNKVLTDLHNLYSDSPESI